MAQSAVVRIVLMRPRVPENLGAIARVMKNLGQSDWAVVQPATLDFRAAARVAVHAQELLDRPRIVESVEQAVADCVWVVGTTSRRVRGRHSLAPWEVAAQARERGPTALVFGDERSGLSNADLLRCHDLSAIPSEPEQPSLNLAQAVLVYLWELRRLEQVAGPGSAAAPGATDAELNLLEANLRSAFESSGFIRGPERQAVGDLLATLRRSRMSRREARLWMAARKSVSATAGGPPSRRRRS